MKPQHGYLSHGRSWDEPVLTLNCPKTARPGYANVPAHEYVDTLGTMRDKINLLAQLICCSKQCILYTGAGISTGAGIADYASIPGLTQKARDKTDPLLTTQGPPPIISPGDTGGVVTRTLSPYAAQPSIAHYSLVDIYRLGRMHHPHHFISSNTGGEGTTVALNTHVDKRSSDNIKGSESMRGSGGRIGGIRWWCQQNHDGLPQKAGMPHHLVNEIHGSLYDPGNPVIPMSGELRSDLFQELLEWESRTDLCIALGTSLSGMNADRVVTSCGERAKEEFSAVLQKNKKEALVLSSLHWKGSVIVGYQQTALDHIAALRIYGPIDVVCSMLRDAVAAVWERQTPGEGIHRMLGAQYPGARMQTDFFSASTPFQPQPQTAETLTKIDSTQESIHLGSSVPYEGVPILVLNSRSNRGGRALGTHLYEIWGYDSITGALYSQVELQERRSSWLLDLREEAHVVVVSGPRKEAEGAVMGIATIRQMGHNVCVERDPAVDYRWEVQENTEINRDCCAIFDQQAAVGVLLERQVDETAGSGLTDRWKELESYDILFQVPMDSRGSRSENMGGSGVNAAGSAAAIGSGNGGVGFDSRTPKRMATMPWRTKLGRWVLESVLSGDALYVPVVNHPAPSGPPSS